MTARPDIRTVRSALTLAQRAPSVHNSQPWRWVLDGDVLHLQPDMTRWLPAEDPRARQLVMSCGAVLHHAVVAFAAAGWQAVQHAVHDQTHGEHLASITFTEGGQRDEDVALSAAIEKRRTDRRRYSSWPVPQPFVEELVRIAARCGVVAEAVGADVGSGALSYLMQPGDAGTPYSDHERYPAELTRSVMRNPYESGIPLASVPLTDGTPQNRSFLSSAESTPTGHGESDEGVLIVLSTHESDLRAQLAAGEACSALLLAATSFGLATCPITRPFDRAITEQAVQRRTGAPWLYPDIVIRIGWAPAAATRVPASPRRDIADVLHFRSLDAARHGRVVSDDPLVPTS